MGGFAGRASLLLPPDGLQRFAQLELPRILGINLQARSASKLTAWSYVIPTSVGYER